MYKSLWYENLQKPFLNPPSWLFRPAWIIMYISLLSSFLIYLCTKSETNKAYGYVYFGLQFVLNILWSPVFFYYKKIGIALLIVIFMIIFTILTIVEFYKVSKLSAYILIPYLLWIIFAAYLNFSFLILN